MTVDGDREALALAWLEHWGRSSDLSPTDQALADEYAETLLPVVDRIVRRRVADELDGWARSFRVCGRVASRRDNRRVFPQVADVLEAGARELRAEPAEDEPDA